MSVDSDFAATESFRKCKCCLDDQDLKKLWNVYDIDGEKEVYGTMIMECFNLPWQPVDEIEFICELCISRLREAVHFKQEILATEEILLSASNDKGEQPDTPEMFQIVQEDDYEEVEYLEIDEHNEKPSILKALLDGTIQGPSNPYASSQGHSTPEEPKRKWPKKKRRGERTKQYKQYTQHDMRQAVKAVRSGLMSCANAAEKYGVPKKTLTVKVNGDNVNSKGDTRDSNNEKHFKLIEEIKTLLLHTTAIPFKTKTTRYYCFYCSTEGPTFEDPDDLRNHTRSKHAHERTKIEMFMRPQWLNEIIKLDVDELHCKDCYMLLPDWNHVFVHLAEVHNIEFDLAYTNIIPYALVSDLQCVLCHQNFNNFGHLDSHMNNHYSNYICYECGDTFLSVSRLDKHLNIHKVGNYPCELCDKIFTLEKYRSKHVSLVHNQESTIKCLYCPEKFIGLFQRHVHVTEHHKDKVKVMTCEYCGRSYTWKPYFLAHMRRRHGTERKHQCIHCSKSFLMKYELKNHMVRHTGERNFLCGLCGVSFTRMINLKKHFQTHKEGQITSKTEQ